MNQPFSLYILLCGNGQFYTGITSDLAERLRSHHLEAGADMGTSKQWTKFHQPVELAFTYDGLENYSVAVRVERYVKSLKKPYKQLLISGDQISLEYLRKKHFRIRDELNKQTEHKLISGTV
jgi:putative endonuclease